MQNKLLAPIGISTYKRLNHLQKTIKALQKNGLAKQSELYIFSDAPQKGDEDQVAKLREYIHTIKGFKKVNIIERTVNDRVANNRGGIKQLLDQYGKIIFLEEDIVTAPGFLQFMNDALNFYEDNKAILTITGYCPPIKISKEYEKDFFVLQRPAAWGFATWAHKFDPFGFEVEQHGIEEFLSNNKEIKKLMQNGEDIYDMLLLETTKQIDALDVKIMYYEHKYNMFTVYPKHSLVQNIGHDGSGIHCGVTGKFHHEKLWDKTNEFKFSNDITVNAKIRKANYSFRKRPLPSFRDRIVKLTQLVGIYPILKRLK